MARRRDDAGESRKDRTTQIVLGIIAALATVIVGYWQFVISKEGEEPRKGTKLSGRVVDSMSGTPIFRAEVALEAKGAPQVMYTDSKGVFAYDISDIVPTVVVRVEAPNYQPFVRRVTLTPDLPFQEVSLLPILPATATKPGTFPGESQPAEIETRLTTSKAIQGITVEPNTDRQFSDYASIANTTLEVCIQACKADTRCKAFVYDNVPTSWGYKSCWLKSSVPPPIHREGSTSGVKNENVGNPGGLVTSNDNVSKVKSPSLPVYLIDLEGKCRHRGGSTCNSQGFVITPPSATSDATATYRIPLGARYFLATLTEYSGTSCNGGNALSWVQIDGETINSWPQGPTTQQEVRVPIPVGAKELTLGTSPVDGAEWCDDSEWGSARFIG